ncbi:MAG: glycosyltransferase family 2 protein, partial [Thermoplasmata archaeon]|nr:glycosyltransferase family 2 protein [Thermoplasmata archaeon]
MSLPAAHDGATSATDASDRRARTAPPLGPPLIVLPTLNEEHGLRATLEELAGVRGFPESVPPEVLVVDGHSTDSTPAVAARFRCRLLPQTGRGKGAAVRDGLEWAVANGFGAVAVLDADGTYPGDQLPAMFRLLERGADIVAGVRRPTERSDSTPRNLVHRVGNGALNTWAALLSRGPILDVCTG